MPGRWFTRSQTLTQAMPTVGDPKASAGSGGKSVTRRIVRFYDVTSMCVVLHLDEGGKSLTLFNGYINIFVCLVKWSDGWMIWTVGVG